MENNDKYISIGKITNFFGIKGEAKVGYSNASQIEKAKTVFLLDDESKKELKIKSCRFQKNFAIVKFAEIDDINDLIQFKGQRLFVLKEAANSNLQKDEFFIRDLINCSVVNEQGGVLGKVTDITSNSSQDLLNIKNALGQVSLVPFVNEFFPDVDIKNKTITIKPIEGLLN